MTEQPDPVASAQVIPLRGPRRPSRPATPAAAADAATPVAGQPEPAVTGPAVTGPARETSLERRAATTLAFLRRRLTGEYQVDDFGLDPDLYDHVIATALRPLYEKWFRVDVHGIENIPAEGPALLVSNHSGTIALDSIVTAAVIHDRHPQHRFLRLLAAHFVFSTALMGPLARKGGATVACDADAQRLLARGELVGVWPEGFKGVGKSFAERYRLQRFGRGGFVATALRAGVPIIPCAVVGAEEIYPKIGEIRALARLVGAPYVPVTPTFPWLGPLGLVPLPAKWIIEFGRPIPTDGFAPGAADDPLLVFDLTDQVRETIQSSLIRRRLQRRSVFF